MAHSLEWMNACKTKATSVDSATTFVKTHKPTTYYTINTLQSMIKFKMLLDSTIHTRSSNILRKITFLSIAKLLILAAELGFLGLSSAPLVTKTSLASTARSKCLRYANRKTSTKASTNASSAAKPPSHQSMSQPSTSP